MIIYSETNDEIRLEITQFPDNLSADPRNVC